MALSKQRVRMPEHLLIKEVSSSSSWTCLGLSPGSCHNTSRLAVSSSPVGAAQYLPGWASSWPGCPHWHRREEPSSSVLFVTLRIIWIENSRFTISLFQIKVLLPPFSIIKCNILSFIFTWYFYVSLSLTFLLCKVLPYICRTHRVPTLLWV